MRAGLALGVAQVLQERKHLKRLTKTHVVAQDASAGARGVLRGEPSHALALVLAQTLVQEFPVLRLAHSALGGVFVVRLHLRLALRVRERRQTFHLRLIDARLGHDARREAPAALKQVGATHRVQRLRQERHEPVPQPNHELRLAPLDVKALRLHLRVRREARVVVAGGFVCAAAADERAADAVRQGLTVRQRRRRRVGAAGDGRRRPRRRDEPGGFQPSLREHRRAVLGAKEHRGGEVIFPVRVYVLEVRRARAQHVEALETVLHRALHAPARQTAQTAFERHAAVLHAVHVDDGSARRAGRDNHLGQVPGAAQVRVRAVRAPVRGPSAGGLHARQHAPRHGAQRAHPGVRGPPFALLHAVHAPLAEPGLIAVGHLREPVARQVRLRVAPVAHHDAVALDVPEVGVRLAAHVTQISLGGGPQRGALARRAPFSLRRLQRGARRGDARLPSRLDGVVALQDVVHLVVVDGDELGDDVLALAAQGRRAPDLLPDTQLLLEIVQLLASEPRAVLVPAVLLERAQVLERPAVAERAGHGGFVRGRDRTASHDFQVLLLHLLDLARAPAYLAVHARLAKIQLLHLALALVVVGGGVPGLLLLRVFGDVAVRRGAVRRRGVHGDHRDGLRRDDGLVCGLGLSLGRAPSLGVAARLPVLFLRLLSSLVVFLRHLGVGLVVQRGHAVVRVEVHHASLPPRPVVRPEHVDVPPHERQLRRVRGLQHARNLGTLDGGRRLPVAPSLSLGRLRLRLGLGNLGGRGRALLAHRASRASSLRKSRDQRGVGRVNVARGGRRPVHHMRLAVHRRSRVGDRLGPGLGRFRRLRRRDRRDRRRVPVRFDRCAHPSRRGRRRARLEVSTEEKRAQIIVKVALPARARAKEPPLFVALRRGGLTLAYGPTCAFGGFKGSLDPQLFRFRTPRSSGETVSE